MLKFSSSPMIKEETGIQSGPLNTMQMDNQPTVMEIVLFILKAELKPTPTPYIQVNPPQESSSVQETQVSTWVRSQKN